MRSTTGFGSCSYAERRSVSRETAGRACARVYCSAFICFVNCSHIITRVYTRLSQDHQKRRIVPFPSL